MKIYRKARKTDKTQDWKACGRWILIFREEQCGHFMWVWMWGPHRKCKFYQYASRAWIQMWVSVWLGIYWRKLGIALCLWRWKWGPRCQINLQCQFDQAGAYKACIQRGVNWLLGVLRMYRNVLGRIVYAWEDSEYSMVGVEVGGPVANLAALPIWSIISKACSQMRLLGGIA